VKQTLYGRRDAAVKLNDGTTSTGAGRYQSSNTAGDSIARLLAAATSAELALLQQSPDSKKRSRNFDGKSDPVNLFDYVDRVADEYEYETLLVLLALLLR